MSPRPVRLVFVCVENSNRSQMAEAFARIHGKGVEAYSAGSRPSRKVGSKAIAAMKEIGYDLSRHESKAIEKLPDGEIDAVVTMGCGDACPKIKAARRLDWQIPDPRDLDPAEFRRVRDQIESRVRELLAELSVDRSSAP